MHGLQAKRLAAEHRLAPTERRFDEEALPRLGVICIRAAPAGAAQGPGTGHGAGTKVRLHPGGDARVGGGGAAVSGTGKKKTIGDDDDVAWLRR